MLLFQSKDWEGMGKWEGGGEGELGAIGPTLIN